MNKGKRCFAAFNTQNGHKICYQKAIWQQVHIVGTKKVNILETILHCNEHKRYFEKKYKDYQWIEYKE